jgi:hypothetical protein
LKALGLPISTHVLHYLYLRPSGKRIVNYTETLKEVSQGYLSFFRVCFVSTYEVQFVSIGRM